MSRRRFSEVSPAADPRFGSPRVGPVAELADRSGGCRLAAPLTAEATSGALGNDHLARTGLVILSRDGLLKRDGAECGLRRLAGCRSRSWTGRGRHVDQPSPPRSKPASKPVDSAVDHHRRRHHVLPGVGAATWWPRHDARPRLACRVSTWFRPAEQLAGDFHTLVPDLPGFGRSGRRPAQLDVPDLAAAAAAFLDERQIDRVTLVGNSMGCAVICEFAYRFPDRLDRAVLVSPAGGTSTTNLHPEGGSPRMNCRR